MFSHQAFVKSNAQKSKSDDESHILVENTAFQKAKEKIAKQKDRKNEKMVK